MPDSPKTFQRMALLLILTLAAAGLLLLGVAELPYKVLRWYADRAAADGSADAFTGAFHEAMRLRLRVGGVLFLALGLGALACHRRIGAWIARHAADLRGQAAAMRGELGGSRRGVPVARRYALLAITAIGAAVRAWHLNLPMRGDEAYSYTNFISAPYFVLLSNYAEPNNHVLHSALARLCVLLLGDSPPAIRIVSFAAGVLVIPAAYLAARAHYKDWAAALLAAALVAGTSELVKFSANARGYMLMLLLFLLLLALAPRLVKEPREALGWALFAVLGALGFYTVPTMLLPFGSICCWIGVELLRTRRELPVLRRIRPLIVAGFVTVALTALLYAPIFMGSGAASVFANKWVTSASFGPGDGNLWRRLCAAWSVWNLAMPGALSLLLLPAALAGTALHHRLGTAPLSPLLLAALWSVLVLTLRGNDPPIRTFLFALPLVLMAASAALASLARKLPVSRHPAATCAACALVAGALCWNTLRTRAVIRSDETGAVWDHVAIAKYLGEEMHEGDSLRDFGIAVPALRYHAGREGIALPWLGILPENPRRRLILAGSDSLPRLDVPRGSEIRILKEFPNYRASVIGETVPLSAPEAAP